MIQIFDYQDYRSFLADFYRDTKKLRSHFSYRSFAMKAKLNSPNYLKLVIDGKRRITEAQIPKFVKGLGLEHYEASYFVSLVNLDNAPSVEMKNYYDQQLAHLKKIGRVKTEVLDEKVQEKLSHWETWFLREYFQIPGAPTEASAIKSRVVFETTEDAIRESIEMLKATDLVSEDPAGLKTKQSILVMGDKIKSEALKSLHREYLELAKLSIDRVPRDRRRLAGLTLALRASDFEKISKHLLSTVSELNKSYSDISHPDEVYHLELALFPITMKRRE